MLAFVLPESLQVGPLQRAQQRDDLLGLEVVVVVDREAPASRPAGGPWRASRLLAVGELVEQAAQLGKLGGAHSLALGGPRALHVRAPAQELLHLALVPVGLPRSAQQGVEAHVL